MHFKLLKPKKVRIQTIPQGTQDASSAWAKASFNLCKQLAIRFQVLDPMTPDPPMPDETAETTDNNESNDADGEDFVEFGRLDDEEEPEDDLDDVVPVTVNENGIPSYYDPEKLTLLDRHQVAWWDETYHQCSLQSK